MTTERVLKAIAKNLITSSGLCPFDRSCPYAASACTAPLEELTRRRSEIEAMLKSQYPDESGLSIMGEGESREQWPCASFNALLFVDPDSFERRDDPEAEGDYQEEDLGFF